MRPDRNLHKLMSDKPCSNLKLYFRTNSPVTLSKGSIAGAVAALEKATMAWTIWVITAVLLFLYRFRVYFQRMFERWNGRIPPGPAAYPLIGTIDADRGHPHLTFQRWASKYGKLFSFYLGERFCVAASDMDSIRRLFRDERFNDRCHLGIAHKLEGNLSKSIVLGNGDLWKEHRRFSLSALRDFGFGKAGGEERVQKEAAHLVAELRKQQGHSFEPKLTLATSVANVVAFMLFSDGVDMDDERFSKFADNVAKNIIELTSGAALDIWTWLRFIYPFSAKFQATQERLLQTQHPLRQLITEHRKSFDPDHPRDYVDAYFCQQESRLKSSGDVGTFTDEQLVRNLSDLYVAGFETTTTFLRWGLVYMILNPEVQKKLQAEIDSVIGSSRLPIIADQSQMPYTNAVITEVFRITYFLPFGVPHCATEDVQFDGYAIPKGTEVWPLMCHHSTNPQVWGDPEVFRPERFLDASGRVIQSLADEVQPFSVGRRACLGEPLARMEVFIFFTAILQHFTVSSKKKPTTEPVVAFVFSPKPFEMTVTPRA